MRRVKGSADSAVVTLIEWRNEGHRLSYVRSIVDAAVTRGIELQILTQESALESNEWGVHLGDISDADVTTLAPESYTARKLPALLRIQRRAGRLVILPEVDRVLHAVVFAYVTRRLPRRTTIIAMRPPRWSPWKRWPASIAKMFLLRSLAATRSVSVLLLEDPLANQRSRVWRWPLGGPTLRLDDPADPLVVGGELPPELARLPESAKLVAVTGAIDDRKQAPLILDGWALQPERDDCVLVIAGAQTEEVRAALNDHPATRRRDVIIIDRYLLLGAIPAIIDRSVALFVLYDGGTSSGNLINAARMGCWVMTTAGGRPARVAAEHKFGIETELTPAGIHHSIQIALDKPAAPEPLPVGGGDRFGDLVLTRTLS